MIKRKKVIKLIVIMFIITCYKCQTDLNLKHTETLSFVKTDITFEKFKSETGLADFENSIKITPNKSTLESKTIDGKFEVSDFNIDTNIIKSMEYHQNKTYTFKIYPKGITSDNYFNLILYKKNNVWEKSIVEMKPSLDNLYKLQNNLTNNFEGQMRQLYNSEITTTSTMKCVTVTIVSNKCNGKCSNPNECSCTGSCCNSTMYYNSCDFGPSNPVSGGGNSNGTGDSNWGGGSSDSNDPNSDDIVIEPNINPTSIEEETLQNSIKTPCQDLESKSNDSIMNSKLVDLKLKAGQGYESANVLYQNATEGLKVGQEFTGDPNAAGAGKEVSLGLNENDVMTPTNCIGFAHCHLNNNSTFKVFSVSDLIAFSKILGLSTRPTSEFTIYVTTEAGTFALKVSDRMKFKNSYDFMNFDQDLQEKKFNQKIKKQ